MSMHIDDPAIERFHSYKPEHYSYLEHLDISLDSEETEDVFLSRVILKIVLVSSVYENNLSLLFRGVRDLHLEIEGDHVQLEEGLTITSLRGSQWEELNYKISGQGGRYLSFFCREFTVQLAEE